MKTAACKRLGAQEADAWGRAPKIVGGPLPEGLPSPKEKQAREAGCGDQAKHVGARRYPRPIRDAILSGQMGSTAEAQGDTTPEEEAAHQPLTRAWWSEQLEPGRVESGKARSGLGMPPVNGYRADMGSGTQGERGRTEPMFYPSSQIENSMGTPEAGKGVNPAAPRRDPPVEPGGVSALRILQQVQLGMESLSKIKVEIQEKGLEVEKTSGRKEWNTGSGGSGQEDRPRREAAQKAMDALKKGQMQPEAEAEEKARCTRELASGTSQEQAAGRTQDRLGYSCSAAGECATEAIFCCSTMNSHRLKS